MVSSLSKDIFLVIFAWRADR